MSLPLTLAIDTARACLQLALLLPDGRVDVDITDIAKGHAEIILDRIGTLLDRNGLSYGDLERIAVTTGPGSFTGLRIGLSVARGLGLARNVPVVGVPTLLAISLSREGPVSLLVDAGRNEAYTQDFSAPGIPSSAPKIVELETALKTAGRSLPDDWLIDIEAIARFGAGAEPSRFPPDPLYVRAADAKPQTKGKVAWQ